MDSFEWLCCGLERRGAPSASAPTAAPHPSTPTAPPPLVGVASASTVVSSSTASSTGVGAGVGAAGPTGAEPTVRPMDDLRRFYDVDWSPKGELGKGHFARVYRGKSRATGIKVAAKRISRSLTRGASLQNEIKALISVSGHPNIVRLYDVFYDEIYVVLILEFLGGGELFARIVKGGAYSERDASRHAKSLASALLYMHERGVVHRDLKPENLVLSDPSMDSPIKISDFGLSKILSEDAATMKTVCGTRAYSAPEVGFGNPKGWKASYTAKVDVWSLGVILYVLLGAYHPFDPYGEGNEQEIWKRICRGEWDFDDAVWDRVSDQAKDLLVHMIDVNPETRFTIQQVLHHPWIVQAEELPDFNLSAVSNHELRQMLGDAIDTQFVGDYPSSARASAPLGAGTPAASAVVARDVEMKDMELA